MSTKTALKRVALVAAAALAIGGVTAVSAQASAQVPTGVTVTVGSVTRTSASTWTATASISATGLTTAAAGDTLAQADALSGGSAGTATVAFSSGGSHILTAAEVTSATTASYSQVLTFTAASTSAANIIAAAGTYINTFHIGTTAAGATSSVVIALNSVVTAATVTAPTTGTYSTVTLVAGHADHYYTITSSGVGSVLYPASAPASTAGTGLVSGASELWYSGATPGAALFDGSEQLVFSAYSATSGTQTITITGDSTAAFTEVLTWGAAPALSVANSFVVPNNSADIQATTVGTTANTLKVTSASADSSLAFVGSPASILAGGATVGVYNNATIPVSISTDTISASVSGPGLLSISKVTYAGAPAVTGAVTVVSTSAQGRSVSTTTAAAYAIVNLYSDGTAGTSTVTVSDSTAGVVLGTFTLTFYSSTIAKLVATTNTNIAVPGSSGSFAATASEGINSTTVTPASTDTGAPVSVVATDANGNKIPSASGIAVSSGTTSVATVNGVYYDPTEGYIFPDIVPVAEGSSVITFSDTATGLVTATATVLVTKALAATVVASTDAATYDPGTKVVYTLTATDAAGNPIADGTYTGFFTTGNAPTSNVGLQGSLPNTTSTTFAGGVSNSTVYAPVNSANVAIAGGTVAAGFLASGTATATNEADFSTTGSSDVAANAATDAANEATDAANAATDAANAAADSADAATQAAQDAGDKADAALAAVTALSQQVTTVLAKVAALSALLVRIIKKVKA